MNVRVATPDDAESCLGIYEPAVVNTAASFELEPPSLEEMRQRITTILQRYPWLVFEREGEVLGYAYAGVFRPRRAYRFCVEDSIYLAPEARGQGVGRLLLAELIARCEAAGIRQMLAVIGDSANTGSIALHRACGFEHTGVFRAAGWKFDRWLDVVMMQRRLGLGADAEPVELAEAK